jgi:hypothetical protein
VGLDRAPHRAFARKAHRVGCHRQRRDPEPVETLCANDDGTFTPRKITLEGTGESSGGHAQQSC